MYLSRRTYVQNWDHQSPESKHEVTVKVGGVIHPHIKPERVTYIVEEVGYWRKANQIHHWFVEHVQGGEDECRPWYVSREKLEELLTTVQEVLADRSKAIDLLPSCPGFFFGDYSYDEWYFKDLMDTEEILTRALAEGGDGSFEYRSSW